MQNHLEPGLYFFFPQICEIYKWEDKLPEKGLFRPHIKQRNGVFFKEYRTDKGYSEVYFNCLRNINTMYAYKLDISISFNTPSGPLKMTDFAIDESLVSCYSPVVYVKQISGLGTEESCKTFKEDDLIALVKYLRTFVSVVDEESIEDLGNKLQVLNLEEKSEILTSCYSIEKAQCWDKTLKFLFDNTQTVASTIKWKTKTNDVIEIQLRWIYQNYSTLEDTSKFPAFVRIRKFRINDGCYKIAGKNYRIGPILDITDTIGFKCPDCIKSNDKAKCFFCPKHEGNLYWTTVLPSLTGQRIYFTGLGLSTCERGFGKVPDNKDLILPMEFIPDNKNKYYRNSFPIADVKIRDYRDKIDNAERLELDEPGFYLNKNNELMFYGSDVTNYIAGYIYVCNDRTDNTFRTKWALKMFNEHTYVKLNNRNTGCPVWTESSWGNKLHDHMPHIMMSKVINHSKVAAMIFSKNQVWYPSIRTLPTYISDEEERSGDAGFTFKSKIYSGDDLAAMDEDQ